MSSVTTLTDHSGARRSPSTTRGEATYKELLQAAEEVFSERGYHHTSVSEICRRAMVANGTFYQYFENKEGIFLELIRRLKGLLQEEINRKALASLPYKDRILSAYRAFLSFIEHNTALYQVFREAEFIKMEIPQAFYGDVARIFMALLREGRERGEIRPLDPEVVAYCLIGIVEFIAMRFIIWEPGGLSRDILQSTGDFILHGLDTGKRPSPPATTASLIETTRLEEPSPSKGEATRKALLKTAEEMFGQDGFYKTSVSGITYAAGVAQGTFYLYFPSKVEIFTELVREINRFFRAQSSKAIRGLEDRREIEREGLRAFFESIRKHRMAYRITREAEFVDEEVGQWYYRRFVQGYVEGLKRGMERGEIRQLNPEALAYSLMGIGHFMGRKWIIWDDLAQVPESGFEEMMRFIMQGVTARA